MRTIHEQWERDNDSNDDRPSYSHLKRENIDDGNQHLQKFRERSFFKIPDAFSCVDLSNEHFLPVVSRNSP